MRTGPKGLLTWRQVAHTPQATLSPESEEREREAEAEKVRVKKFVSQKRNNWWRHERGRKVNETCGKGKGKEGRGKGAQ